MKSKSTEGQPGLFDDPPKKGPYNVHRDITRHRHGGNQRSEDANQRTNKQSGCALLEQWYKAQGPKGGIQEQAAIALGMRHQTASARQSDLKRLGVLVRAFPFRSIQTTSGCWADVYIHRDFAKTEGVA